MADNRVMVPLASMIIPEAVDHSPVSSDSIQHCTHVRRRTCEGKSVHRHNVTAVASMLHYAAGELLHLVQQE